MKIIFATVGAHHPPQINAGHYTNGRMLDMGSRPFLRIETTPGFYRLVPLDSPQIIGFDFALDEPNPLAASEAFARDFARITSGDISETSIADAARRALIEISGDSAPIGATIPI